MTWGLCLPLPTPGHLFPLDRPLLSRLSHFLLDNQHLRGPSGHTSTPSWTPEQLLAWLQVTCCEMSPGAWGLAGIWPAGKPSRSAPDKKRHCEGNWPPCCTSASAPQLPGWAFPRATGRLWSRYAALVTACQAIPCHTSGGYLVVIQSPSLLPAAQRCPSGHLWAATPALVPPRTDS